MRQYLSVAAVGILQCPLPSRVGVRRAASRSGSPAASRSSGTSPVARRRKERFFFLGFWGNF